MPEPDVFEERDRAKHAHIFPIEGEVIVFRPTGARPDTQTQREPTQ